MVAGTSSGQSGSSAGQTPGSPGYGVVKYNTPTVAEVTGPNKTYTINNLAQAPFLTETNISGTTGSTDGTTVTSTPPPSTPPSPPPPPSTPPSGKYGGGGNVTSSITNAPATATTAQALMATAATTLPNSAAGARVTIPSSSQVAAIQAAYGINPKRLQQNGYSLEVAENTPVLTKNVNGNELAYTLNGQVIGEIIPLAGGGRVIEAVPAGMNITALQGPLVAEFSAVNQVRNQG